MFMKRLNENEIEKQLNHLQGWIHKDKHIQKEFSFNDFNGSMKFVNNISLISEKIDHHPGIMISYNKVDVKITTHSLGGLSVKDFELAKEIDVIS